MRRALLLKMIVTSVLALILILPLMKAETAFVSPFRILSQSSESTSTVALGFSAGPS